MLPTQQFKSTNKLFNPSISHHFSTVLFKKKSFGLFTLSILSGILLSLSWPERGFTPFIFIAFVPLLSVNHYFSSAEIRRSGRKVFGYFYIAMLTWNVL